MPVETEIKYVIPLKALEAAIDLGKLSYVEIAQHYFSAEMINQHLIPQLIAAGEREAKELPNNCSNGRVRATISSKKSVYTITVKAPRKNVFSRLEVETEISREEFKRLQQYSDLGDLRKRRYEVEGKLLNQSRKGIEKLIAEIDIYQEIAGKLVDLLQPEAFGIVEIETSEQALEQVRAGQHTFDFLSKATEVMSLPTDLQKYFKNTYLAQFGLNQQMIAKGLKS
jgi:hypothetical protein